jgi:hypothetical protein
MKHQIIIFYCLLISLQNFGQEKLSGKYEYNYREPEGFALVKSIDFFSQDSFVIKKFSNQICYRTIQYFRGKYIIKNDTIILVSTVPKNKLLSLSSINLTTRQFVYSINHYVDSVQSSLNFLFFDKDLNILNAKPIHTKRTTDSLFTKEKTQFLKLKFQIPKNYLYFSVKYSLGQSTTFSLDQIKGKIIADKINSSSVDFDEPTIYEDEDEGILNTYTDITNEKYLLSSDR